MFFVLLFDHSSSCTCKRNLKCDNWLMKFDSNFSPNILSMVQNAPFGFWSWDIKTNKEWWSDGFYRLLQLDPATTVPSYEFWLEEIVHPNDKTTVVDAVEQHLTNNTPYSLQIRMKVGTGWKWFETTGQAILNADGEPELMNGTIHHVDLLVQTNSTLTEQNEILNEISRLGSIGSWKIDLIQNKMIWSEEVYNIHDAELSYTPNVREGIEFYTPEYRDMVTKAVEKAIQENQMFHFEAKILTAKSRIKWVKSIGKIITDAKGKAITIVGLFQDITRDMESRIEKDNAFRIIEQQNERLMNFAHIVSHNLRTHSGNIEMLHGIAKNVHDEKELNEILVMLEKASSRLSETIVHLNEVVAMQVNKDLPITSIPIKSQIQSILDSINARILKENASIEVDVLPSHSILFNAAYFESILINLISNALNYKSPERDPKIVIRTENLDSGVVLSIQDNGLGINLDLHKDKIFGLYKTFHNLSTSRGIGLYMVKNQLDSLGSSISVESKVNVGTTFRITFPN